MEVPVAVKLLSFPQLKSEKGIGYCRDHLRRLVKAKLFPNPVQLSAARIAWREEDVDRWLHELAPKSGEG
jgi:predicted DNA-binding transcriptional regulator AlpA